MGGRCAGRTRRFRLGFNAREGPYCTRSATGTRDGGARSSTASPVAELVIPYGDPRPFEGWRNAFDIGEYGIGMLANSLELGCDCLGQIRYFDVQLADGRGEPYLSRTRSACMRKTTASSGSTSTGRATGDTRCRRLVVSFIITVGNYEYAFYWYFYQDGTIELEVKLTGIVLTAALPPGETSDYGTVVAPQTLAAHHQHFFSIRLDMAVDGDRNSVFEVETEAAPMGPTTPMGMRSGRAARCCGQSRRRNG